MPSLSRQYIDSDVPGEQVISLEPHSNNVSIPEVQTRISNVSNVMQDVDPDLMDKFEQFRVLIISRANAGKMTILQRIFNSTEDPVIYNDQGKKVPFTKPELLDTDAIDVQSGGSCDQGR